MRATLLILCLFAAVAQSSCGILAHQANNAKHILQWPFRAELDPRHLDGISDLEREIRFPSVV
jgi:hypothetical protein